MTKSADCFHLRVCLSEESLSAVKKKLEEDGDIPENVETCLDVGTLGIEEVLWLHKNLKNGDWKLHEVLMKSEIKLPEPVVLPRNPELEARIQRLKAEQEDREYKFMTKNVDSVRMHYPEDTIAYQLKQINKQLIAVLQFVFSVGAGFAFGFVGIDLMVGDLEFGFRLLLGVIFSLIIALAEIYFLAKKLAEDFEPPVQKLNSVKKKQD